MPRLNSDHLSGNRVVMVNDADDKVLHTFNSMNEVKRKFNFTKAYAQKYIYSKTRVEVTWRNKLIKVYFKEEN